MKKQLLLSVLLIAVTMLLICCVTIPIDQFNEFTKEKQVTSESQNTSSCEDTTIYMTYPDKSINRMPAQLVSDMIRNYQVNQLTAIKKGIRIDDAKAIWFDLETLKKFIYNIEKLSKCNGDIPKEDLGIRMYYASYPLDERCSSDDYNNEDNFEFNVNWDTNLDLSKAEDKTTREDHLNRHTLVMIPTKRIDTVNLDFNPFETTPNKQELDYIFGSPEEDCNKSILSLTVFPQNPGSYNPKAKNHGGLFPPRDEIGMAFKYN